MAKSCSGVTYCRVIGSSRGLHEPLNIHSLQRCTFNDLVTYVFTLNLSELPLRNFSFEANMISHTENSELYCVGNMSGHALTVTQHALSIRQSPRPTSFSLSLYCDC